LWLAVTTIPVVFPPCAIARAAANAPARKHVDRNRLASVRNPAVPYENRGGADPFAPAGRGCLGVSAAYVVSHDDMVDRARRAGERETRESTGRRSASAVRSRARAARCDAAMVSFLFHSRHFATSDGDDDARRGRGRGRGDAAVDDDASSATTRVAPARARWTRRVVERDDGCHR